MGILQSHSVFSNHKLFLLFLETLITLQGADKTNECQEAITVKIHKSLSTRNTCQYLWKAAVFQSLDMLVFYYLLGFCCLVTDTRSFVSMLSITNNTKNPPLIYTRTNGQQLISLLDYCCYIIRIKS